MWSLGVLLYTLLFSENPFCDVGEILDAKLKPPFPLSPGMLFCLLLPGCSFCLQFSLVNFPCAFSQELHRLLCGLLHPVSTKRMTLDQLLLQSWISQPISLSEYSWSDVVPATQSFCEFPSAPQME